MWTLAAAALVLSVTYTFPPKRQVHVIEKLASFARAVYGFSVAVAEEHRLWRLHVCECSHEEGQQSKEEEGSIEDILQKANQNMLKARRVARQERLDLYLSMHDAAITSAKDQLIDPHSLTPLIASDLIDAIVIPVFLSLVQTHRCDCLYDNDLEDKWLQELKRLVLRLETQTKREGSVVADSTLSTMSRDSSEKYGGSGPFSRAIARAHRRLDNVGVPACWNRAISPCSKKERRSLNPLLSITKAIDKNSDTRVLS